MRIFWLFNHPAPYKVEFFNRLGRRVDLTVYFERVSEAGRNKTFYGRQAETFHAYYGHPLKLGGFNSYSREPLKFLIDHAAYDLIVLNGWRTLTERLCISYCRKHRIPYVFYINGGIAKQKENNLVYFFKRHYISGADFYLAPDPRSKEYLIHYGAKAEDIFIYPYGSVAEDQILEQPYEGKAVQKLRKKLGISEGRAFVTAGFFIKRKNFTSLLEAWKHMPATDHLYLIGEGKEKKHYQKTIRANRLDNVHILPFMDHASLFRFYRACDAFVFPSHEDIYGHVITEAMSQGLPVFSSPNVNASRALIEKGVNGDILDFHNAEEVARTLQKPFDPSMRLSALKTARRYSYEESAAEQERIFAQFVQALQEKRA